MDAAAAEHARNIERAEAADKRKMESREQERERLRKEIARKEKEIQGQEERTEKARQDVEKAIAKAEKKAMDERLDRERDFWKNMRETTSNGLAEILIAEQEGASWWSGIDGMRHRAVKAGITGATKLGINWLAGAAGMAAGGPGGAMLGATGMEFLSSFLGFRAGGGHTMRAQVVGEDRAEVFRPTVPGTIYNNTQSTSYNGGITVILPNARSADDIARDLPRATRSASSNRRQTSR
jgi:flagellar biosynthesis GTPase FlhF